MDESDKLTWQLARRGLRATDPEIYTSTNTAHDTYCRCYAVVLVGQLRQVIIGLSMDAYDVNLSFMCDNPHPAAPLRQPPPTRQP